jgi:hypothetical protein
MRRLILAIAALSPLAANAQTAQPSPSGGQQRFIARFDAANTTHDGHLTLAQAQAAGMHYVVKHFAQIDSTNKGYITLEDVRAYRQAHLPQGTVPAQPASS